MHWEVNFITMGTRRQIEFLKMIEEARSTGGWQQRGDTEHIRIIRGALKTLSVRWGICLHLCDSSNFSCTKEEEGFAKVIQICGIKVRIGTEKFPWMTHF